MNYLMTQLTTVLIIALLSGCGTALDTSNHVSGYPSRDEDPLTMAFRENFRVAKPITRGELSLLRLNHSWTCEVRNAYRNDNRAGTYKIMFSQKFEFIHLNTLSGPKFNTDVFAFVNNRLLGSRQFDDGQGGLKLKHMAWRINSRNELLGEGYSYWGVAKDHVKSYSNPDKYVVDYTYCTAGDNHPDEVVSISGACRINSEEFNTEEGGCLDLSTGLVWSMSDNELGTHPKAQGECDQLVDSGFDDWRLPREEELLELVNDDPARVISHFYFEPNQFFWSRDLGNAPYGWAVNLADGNSVYMYKSPEDYDIRLGGNDYHGAATVCVRKPLDWDNDRIPDSSDRCPDTPKGTKVHVTGPQKGCPVN